MIRGSSSEKLRSEARAWVLRLQDAHTAADRKAFEQWVGQNPAHRRAYDEVQSSYDTSVLLRTSAIARQRDLEGAFPRRPLALRAAVAAASIGAVALITFHDGNPFKARPSIAIEAVMLSSGTAEKDVRLADGSGVSLAPQSEVEVNLDRNERLARIRKGQVRLTIAKESRPFRILAGDRVIQASDGIFDAAVSVRGASITPVANGSANVEQHASAATGPEPNAGRPAQLAQSLEFNAEPLGSAVDRINRIEAGPAIELDPGLARLRVTGVFQHGGSEALARSLALAFNLKLVTTSSGALLLTR